MTANKYESLLMEYLKTAAKQANSNAPPEPHSFLDANLSDRLREVSLENLLEMLRQAGLARNPSLRQFSEYRLQLLGPYHVASDVERLEKEGIQKETLATALMIINLAPGFDYFFRDLFGDRRSRKRQAKVLLAPIPILTKIAELIGDASKIPSEKIPNPLTTIAGLYFYASMLTWGEKIYEFIDANSLLEVGKYALAGLVKRVTHKFHDREVSALTGAALQKEYDETSHRVWRIRNYERLDKAVPIAALLLQAFNTVLSEP